MLKFPTDNWVLQCVHLKHVRWNDVESTMTSSMGNTDLPHTVHCGRGLAVPPLAGEGFRLPPANPGFAGVVVEVGAVNAGAAPEVFAAFEGRLPGCAGFKAGVGDEEVAAGFVADAAAGFKGAAALTAGFTGADEAEGAGVEGVAAGADGAAAGLAFAAEAGAELAAGVFTGVALPKAGLGADAALALAPNLGAAAATAAAAGAGAAGAALGAAG